jgi:hypothetical protein
VQTLSQVHQPRASSSLSGLESRDGMSDQLSLAGIIQDVHGRLSHREALARGEIFLSFPSSLSALVKNLSMCAGRRVVPCDWTCTLAGYDDSVRTVRVLREEVRFIERREQKENIAVRD